MVPYDSQFVKVRRLVTYFSHVSGDMLMGTKRAGTSYSTPKVSPNSHSPMQQCSNIYGRMVWWDGNPALLGIRG